MLVLRSGIAVGAGCTATQASGLRRQTSCWNRLRLGYRCHVPSRLPCGAANHQCRRHACRQRRHAYRQQLAVLCQAALKTVGAQVVALAVEVAEAFRDLLQLNHRMGRIQVRAAAQARRHRTRSAVAACGPVVDYGAACRPLERQGVPEHSRVRGRPSFAWKWQACVLSAAGAAGERGHGGAERAGEDAATRPLLLDRLCLQRKPDAAAGSVAGARACWPA